MILERMREIATLFDQADGKTQTSMITMYVTSSHIVVDAFDPEKDYHPLFNFSYNRETGKTTTVL